MTRIALHEAYTERYAAAHAAATRGTPVVGVVGNSVPIELILAAGRFPIVIAAELASETPHADEFMERDVAPEIRSLFEQALRGDLSFLELLVVPRSTDGYLELFYYLKEVQRLGCGAMLPPLYLYDIQHSQTQRAYAYGLERTRELKRRLEVIGGSDITDATLDDAIERTNRWRQALQRLIDERRCGCLSGIEAMVAVGAGYFMGPDAHTSALETYLDERRPASSTRPRLLALTAVPLYHTSLHAAVEEAGATIVAEDGWWGARAGMSEIATSGDLLTNIFDHYVHDSQSPRVIPPSLRDEWFTRELTRQDVDGVLFYVPPGDLWFGWDYPRLLQLTERASKRSLLLRDEATTESGSAAIATHVGAFIGGDRL